MVQSGDDARWCDQGLGLKADESAMNQHDKRWWLKCFPHVYKDCSPRGNTDFFPPSVSLNLKILPVSVGNQLLQNKWRFESWNKNITTRSPRHIHHSKPVTLSPSQYVYHFTLRLSHYDSHSTLVTPRPSLHGHHSTLRLSLKASTNLTPRIKLWANHSEDLTVRANYCREKPISSVSIQNSSSTELLR